MRTSTSIFEPSSAGVDRPPTECAPGSGRGGPGWSLTAAATVTGVFLLSNAATPLYAHWQSVWGFDSGLLTVVFAAYMVGLIASLVVAGRLADRFGRKAVLVPGLVAAVVSSVLFLGAQDVVWLLAARLLAGVAVGAAVTAGMAAVVDLAPARRRRTGSLIASVSMVFGAGLGPLLAGGLAAASRRPQTLVFSVVLGVELAALAVAIALPLKRPAAPPPRRPVARSGARLFVWPSPPRRNRRELRRGIGAFGPGLAATSFVLSLGPTVLNSVGVSGTLAAGAVVCAMFLAATGVQFALARLTTRTHLVLSSVAAVAASVLVVLAVTVAPTAVLAISGFLLAGAAQGLGQLAGLSLIAAHVPADKRAESNAVLNIGGYVPAGVLAVLTGYASDAFGLPTAVALFGAVLAAAALTALAALAAVGRRAGHQRTAAAAEGE